MRQVKYLSLTTDDVIVTHELCIDMLGFQKDTFCRYFKVDFNELLCPTDANRGRK